MSEKNVKTVTSFLTAMRAQDAASASQYVHPKLVQHSPFLQDGIEGLRQSVHDFFDWKLSVVRMIEDDPFVVAQLRPEQTGETLFAVYRLQDGLIAEQWAFSSPDAPPNKSGHTQRDGPTEARHLANTVKNKAFLQRYYETFHLAGRRDRNEDFFKGDLMIRHEPGVRDGVGEFLRDVGVLMQHRTIDELKLLVGQGDLVFVAAKGTHEGAQCVYIDLYRVEGEKVVEHWGFPQNVPPRAEWKNPNGML